MSTPPCVSSKHGRTALTCRVLLLLTFCVCLLLPGLSRADETIIVTLTLNQQKKGDFFIILRDDGDYLLRADDLAAIGVQRLPQERIDVEGVPHISLRFLTGVEHHFDEATLTMELTAAPELLPKSTLDLAPVRNPDVIYPRDNSIFLNYGIDYSAGGDNFGFEGLTVGNELGVRRHDLLLLTDTLYTESANDSRFVRLNTSLTYDDRKTLQRIIGGDLFAFSGDLGSGVQLGGLSVSKLYRINPYYIRYPLFNISGMASLPSDVELYVDGVKVHSQRFAPGEFELSNFQGSGGAENIEIVIRDALGREERIFSPFYFTDQILRRGLHEYSYNFGLLRREYGQESNNYADPAVSAFHRYGLTDALNLGLRGEAGNGLANFGFEAAMKTGSIGLLRLEGAGSEDDEGSGAAGLLSYDYYNRQFRGRLALQRFSNDFRTLGNTDETAVKRKLNLLAGLGYATPQLGSFGIDYIRTKNFQEAERETLSFSWSRRFWQRAFVNTTLRQMRQNETSYEVTVNLTWSLDRNYSIAGAVRREEGTNIQSIEARRYIPSGEGTGWNLRGERTKTGEDQSFLFNSVAQHNARHAILRGDFSLNRSEMLTSENLRLSLAGALVHIGDTYAVTRPVTDSFALVSVGAADGVGVYVNGQTSGHTNRRGKVVIPDLSSYYDNQVSIEDKDIPLDYLMPRIRLNVSPPLRSGSCINFPLQKYQAFTGTLIVTGADGPVPLAYAELDLATPAGPVTFWTGEEGEFYLDSQQVEFDLTVHQGCEALKKKEVAFLPAGVYPLTIKLEGHIIPSELTIPAVVEQYAELGKIVLPVQLPAAAGVLTPVELTPETAATEADHSLTAPPPETAPVEQIAAEADADRHLPAAVATTIHFPFDQVTPVAADMPLLATVTRILLTIPGFTVQIEGYTCRLGDKSYNERLGQRRAEAIRKYLLAQGVAAEKITEVTSYGVQHPECTARNADCLRQNRRVVLLLFKTPEN